MTKIIYTNWVAAKLRDRGFQIIRVLANPHKPTFDCYEFEDTPEFEQALTEITKK